MKYYIKNCFFTGNMVYNLQHILNILLYAKGDSIASALKYYKKSAFIHKPLQIFFGYKAIKVSITSDI